MAKEKIVDDFSEENEVTSNFVAFNVPLEDKIMGTLIAVREQESNLPTKRGKIEKVYDLKADYGSFHKLDKKKKVIDTPVIVNEGEIWSVSKESLDSAMRNVKLGQKVGFKFMEEKEAKQAGFNPAKIVKVFTPKNDDGSFKMDKEWLEQEGRDFNKDTPFD